MGFARRVADQLAFVAHGGIPVHGPPDQIFSPEAPSLVRTFLDRALRY
jgi:ABC-type polar amino acid transport system ATPase subunit